MSDRKPQEQGADIVVTPPGQEPAPFDFEAFLKEQADNVQQKPNAQTPAAE
jgi:hypothetical protein